MPPRSGLALAARDAMVSVVPGRMLATVVGVLYPRIEPELARLGELMPRGGTALDVGAWLGPWSRRMIRYADRVVAIEAHPDLADLLRATVPGVTVLSAAASDEPGEIALRVPRGGPAIGVSSIEHGTGDLVVVPTVRIDDLALPDVRFIKLDIEGHELRALRGAQRTIARDGPVVLVELEARMQPVAPVVELMRSWGYRGYVLPGSRWIPLVDFDLVNHQRAAIGRVDQSFVRRLAWPRPRYVNMVLFRREG